MAGKDEVKKGPDIRQEKIIFGSFGYPKQVIEKETGIIRGMIIVAPEEHMPQVALINLPSWLVAVPPDFEKRIREYKPPNVHIGHDDLEVVY